MERDLRLTRRELLAAAAALTVSTCVPKTLLSAPMQASVPQRSLGSTGEKVSLLGLGGYHVGTQAREEESIAIIRRAVDNGITFMDNCWDYNNGESEIRMGKALRNGYRRRVFLMTKIDGRDKATAAQQIEESLGRLQTDTIDLVQIHEVIRLSDPDRIFGPGGSIEAVVAAKQAGKIRFIGFTGHKSPDIHLKMLETASRHGFTFDTVQMPLNVMDAHFNSFEKKVLPILIRHKIGVLGMKPLADANILRSKTATAKECLRYAMSLPTSVVITGCDSLPILNQALEAGRSFTPYKEEEIAVLLKRTAKAAQSGEFEGYKTTRDYDGTYHNPEWLGSEQDYGD